jgi:hypothetical protein
MGLFGLPSAAASAACFGCADTGEQLRRAAAIPARMVLAKRGLGRQRDRTPAGSGSSWCVSLFASIAEAYSIKWACSSNSLSFSS